MADLNVVEGPDGSLMKMNVCAKCGKFTHSAVGISEGGAPVQQISFSCPHCGHMNVEGGGVHSVERIDGQLRWVFREMTADQLRELKGTLSEALTRDDVTVEGVAAAVEPTSTALANMLRACEDRQGLISFVSMILAMIALVLQLHDRGDSPPPPAQIEQVIVNVQSGNVEGYPRNEKCFCGSGHKFKKCHGRHSTADPPPASQAPR